MKYLFKKLKNYVIQKVAVIIFQLIFESYLKYSVLKQSIEFLMIF